MISESAQEEFLLDWQNLVQMKGSTMKVTAGDYQLFPVEPCMLRVYPVDLAIQFYMMFICITNLLKKYIVTAAITCNSCGKSCFLDCILLHLHVVDLYLLGCIVWKSQQSNLSWRRTFLDEMRRSTDMLADLIVYTEC